MLDDIQIWKWISKQDETNWDKASRMIDGFWILIETLPFEMDARKSKAFYAMKLVPCLSHMIHGLLYL